MQSAFLQYGDSKIHYLRGGEGKEVLLCLHGYGESAQTFAILEPLLGARFSILAIDLPFHGQTVWEQGLAFRPEELRDIVLMIVGPTTEKIFLLGYSMGGRAALTLLEKMPRQIERVILLAPDGLIVNCWYWLATQTWLGNRVFRFSMKHPSGLFLILRLGHWLHLVNPGIYKFTLTYIDHGLVREHLYKRWTVMRKFNPRLRSIRATIQAYHIQIRLLYGAFDRIIRAKRGLRFMRGIESWCRLETVDTGHHLLKERYLETLKNMLED